MNGCGLYGICPHRIEIARAILWRRIDSMNFAVILSGGIGTRMGMGDFPKQFIKVKDRTILEYTLDAFESAIKLGVDMVEFDVRKTLDNKLIVYHDSEIEGKELAKTNYDELQLIADSKGFRIPTFLEVIKLCHNRVFMDIEIKEVGYEYRIVKLVQKYLNYEEYSIKSFYDVTPYRVKLIDPNITVGLLLGRDDADFKMRCNEIFPGRRLKACHADFVSPYPALMLCWFTRRMNHAGFPVYVWTVNNKFMTKFFIKHSKIAGLITDRPDRMKEIMKKLKLR